MKLQISAKQPGRKQPLIANRSIDIEDIGSHPTVRQLLLAVVTQQVEEYNSKTPEKNLIPFLSKETINEQAGTGKVGFDTLYNDNKANLQKAREAALLAFGDGLFVLFCNDEQFDKLDTIIPLTPDTVITFIRLTFLAGSYW
ncbi:MAG: hypothetical protein P0Y53_18595 [Candidatus Pseudobacter hemicellulosilyticus]|uniref:Uncharacterized protein n=1 Tax=Candidatus Pseudobacter hemicellulosilyticus TaxID=3121375 RepID=A0AAJ5WPF9_9BACT|nr:MAG: hypothetical protein P0Y53_18595 [Pseudobacter sp.]